MIKEISLRNWRAYVDATVDLAAPVILFVAPNGVGKSSLVQAARWALFGEPAGRKAKSAVRSGSSEASVAVRFHLSAEHSDVLVTRTLTASGRSTFEAVSGEAPLSEEFFAELLTGAWGADQALIDRLTFGSADLPTGKSAFPVREHLAATLGVTPLLNAAEELETRRKSEGVKVKDLRDAVEVAQNKVREAANIVDVQQGDLEQVVASRSELAERISTAQARANLATAWDSYHSQTESYSTEVSELIAAIGELADVDPSEPLDSLRAAQQLAQSAVESLQEEAASAAIASARSANASDLLSSPVDTCPTCLRPLSDHERITALDSHGLQITTVKDAARGASEEVANARGTLARLGEMHQQFSNLTRPTPPTEDHPGPDTHEQLGELREQDGQLAEQVGELRTVIAAQVGREQLLAGLADQERALALAANEEQLLTSTSKVLNELANKTIKDRIDPLIADLSHRWKMLFGSEGLTLEPTGELTVHSGGNSLGLADLSGGEQATAFLVTRLLMAAATTQIPTIWFDEPLERLDPRRRAAVAQTLVRAGQSGTIPQLIITTFEERIAHHLAAADPATVRIVHAETEPLG